MKLEELGPVVRLWRRAREGAMPALEARMGHAPADDLAFFRDSVMRENEVFVALREEEPVALLGLRDGVVGYLYVDPPAQRQGVGTALLDLAKRRSAGGLSLFTHRANRRARDFYERRGFRAVRFGMSPAPEREPDVLYRWDPGDDGEA